MIEISTLAALMASFFRERKTAAGEADAEEFKRWLQAEAVPQIMEASDELLALFQHADSSQHEKLDDILGRLEEIAGELGLKSTESAWEDLSDAERRLLWYLYESVQEDPYGGGELRSIDAELDIGYDDIRRAARRLGERGLLGVTPTTSSTRVRIKCTGILLAWRCDHSSDSEAQTNRMNEFIRKLPRSQSLRIREIHDETGVPAAVIDAYCNTLSNQGLMRYETGYGAIEANLVHSPSEGFREEPSSLDKMLSAALRRE